MAGSASFRSTSRGFRGSICAADLYMSLSRGPVRRNAPFERNTRQWHRSMQGLANNKHTNLSLETRGPTHTHIYFVTKPRCIGCRVCNDFRYTTLLYNNKQQSLRIFAALSQASIDRHGPPREPITVRACVASVSLRGLCPYTHLQSYQTSVHRVRGVQRVLLCCRTTAVSPHFCRVLSYVLR